MTDYKEITAYIEDYFKKRIHDDGLDGLLEVATRIFKPNDEESFIVITFILKMHYYFRHALSVLTIDNVVNIKEYLNYIYDDAKESLFKKQKEDMLGT